MTSKEALKELKCVSKWSKDRFELIEKDLEVLEILKKHFYEEYKIPSGPYSLLFRLNGTPEYVKVKEWLEDDK